MKSFLLLPILVACSTSTKTTIGSEINDTGGTIVDADGDGYFSDEDCNDLSSNVHPGLPELCDGIDNNCDGEIDEHVLSSFYLDQDNDGFGDTNQSTEACEAPEGYSPISNDCDDNNPVIFPGADELCDGLDNDCDDEIDNANNGYWYQDSDGDGYGANQEPVIGCAPDSTWVNITGDCNDLDPNINPFGIEACDEQDNDCDGYTDEGLTSTYYLDSDGDGFGDIESTITACSAPEGYVTNNEDCDDVDSDVFPLADEFCGDFVDNNCDGNVDEASAVNSTLFYADSDGDSYGNPSVTQMACAQPPGYVSNNTDCNDQNNTVHPNASEYCFTPYDDDCDGQANESDAVDLSTFYSDLDSDGHGGTAVQSCAQPSGTYLSNTDCDENNADIYQGATEICNSIDDDCDGFIDDADNNVDTSTGTQFFLDFDQDGYGSGQGTYACQAPTGYVELDGDCNESSAATNPGAAELCDGSDQNCDGLVDNDADGDGYPDATCGGNDCDDSDPAILPEIAGGCALGETCKDVLDNGYSIGDGTYMIDPDGYNTGLAPFEVFCDMTTDGGGWTEIAYSANLGFSQHHSGGDAYRFLPNNFSLELSTAQITALQDLSTEGWQEYVGLCEHVIHYFYNASGSYDYAFGFRYFDQSATSFQGAFPSVANPEISVIQDGCKTNGGEAGLESKATIFLFETTKVPIINVYCRDCGDSGEKFGSPLTNNPAWLR